MLDVFSYCNLRCPSCIVGNKFGDIRDWPKGLMSAELLDAILRKAKSEFSVEWIAVYNWTEPLLHPKLPELLEVVNRHQVVSSVSSNLNVRDYDFDRLMRARPTSMRISLSGFTQPVYERGHAGGDIELVKRNLAALARARDKAKLNPAAFQVYFHIYRYNRHEVEPMRELCTKLGFPFATGYAQIFPVEKIISIRRGLVSAPDRALLDNLLMPLDRALAITAAQAQKSCRLLDRVVTINVAGEVMLCCGTSMNSSNTIGPFLELGIEEIQARKAKHRLCGPCLDLGIPDYFDACPPLAKEFDAIQQRSSV